jgi:hypothetical protein
MRVWASCRLPALAVADLEVVQYLITDAGSDKEARDKDNMTAVHWVRETHHGIRSLPVPTSIPPPPPLAPVLRRRTMGICRW